MVTASRSSRRPRARAVSSPTGSLRRVGTCGSSRRIARPRSAPPSEALEAARNSDAILFTSASTVSSFVSAAGVDGVPPVVVCIGPVTAEAAIDLGVTVTAVPDEHTIPAMVAVLVEVLRP